VFRLNEPVLMDKNRFNFFPNEMCSVFSLVDAHGFLSSSISSGITIANLLLEKSDSENVVRLLFSIIILSDLSDILDPSDFEFSHRLALVVDSVDDLQELAYDDDERDEDGDMLNTLFVFCKL